MNQAKHLSKHLLVFSLFLIAILTISGCKSGGVWGFNEDASVLGGGGSISGTIVASASIKLSLRSGIRAQSATSSVPISGAEVWVEDYPHITSTTGEQGNYVLLNIPLGLHRVVAKFTVGTGSSKRTYKVRSLSINVNSAATLMPGIDLDLEPANNTASGILKDQDGNPMINTKISVWGDEVTTDSFGRFELPGLPEGSEAEVIKITSSTGQTISVVVAFGPAGTSFVELYLPEANSSNIPPRIILLRESPAINIAPGATVNFWAIYADPDGEISDFTPLEWSVSDGTKVSSSLPLPVSLQDKFDLFSKGLAKSQIGVAAILYTAPSSEGYPTISVSCKDKGGLHAAASLRVPVSSGSQPPVMPVNHAPVPVITAQKIVAAGTNLALTVAANDPDGDVGLSYLWSVSPAKGTFSNTQNNDTVWTVPAEAGVYTISCKVSDGELEGTATHNVTVISDTPITSPGKITGYVRDVDTGLPIANALVAISGTDMYAISDTNGRFEFNDIKAGTYTLIASRNSYQIKTFTGIVVPAS